MNDDTWDHGLECGLLDEGWGAFFMIADLSDIHARLFNHRPFVQGEVRHFVREFEDQRGDREVERVFRVLERVTELRDEHVDQVCDAAQTHLPAVQATLARTRTLCQNILDQNRTREIVSSFNIRFSRY